jgi:hypothetical protein
LYPGGRYKVASEGSDHEVLRGPSLLVPRVEERRGVIQIEARHGQARSRWTEALRARLLAECKAIFKVDP